MICIKNINKGYDKNIVLENITINVNPGQVYSLLGKNGAGKTTLINLLLDLLEPDSGAIELFNKNLKKINTADKTRIGAVTEELPLIDEFNGYDYLYFIGKMYKLSGDKLERRINDLFHYFFEDPRDLKKSTSNYSHGMKKKIAFCAAVMHTPDLLILDEPFSGLDLVSADLMIRFLKLYQRDDRVIFMSSHDLSYVEKITTHIGVLHERHLVFDSLLQDFTENGIQKIDAALLNILKPRGEGQLDKFDWT